MSKKITAKTLGFTIPVIRDLLAKTKEGEKVGLYQLMGAVKSTRSGISDYGPWVAFTGIVEAIIFSTGEVVMAGECLIPGGVTAVLEAQLIANQKADPTAQVHFGFEISVFKTDTTIGFEYDVKSLLKKDANAIDPLADLRANLLPTASKVKKLASA